jgi:hypothetical protein
MNGFRAFVLLRGSIIAGLEGPARLLVLLSLPPCCPFSAHAIPIVLHMVLGGDEPVHVFDSLPTPLIPNSICFTLLPKIAILTRPHMVKAQTTNS